MNAQKELPAEAAQPGPPQQGLRARLLRPPNQKETELLEAIGADPARFHVLTRRPIAVAVGPRPYLPGLLGGLIVFALTWRHGAAAAIAAGLVGAVALTACLIAHEAGHLFLARYARGVKPRMLVVVSAGGISIVEGRYADPRGAALFAVGGPLGSIAAALVLLSVGLFLPVGALATALVAPAILSVMLAAVNLLPVAPMDGYILFRSWMWAELHDRSEAERRAIEWSRNVVLWGLLFALVAFEINHLAGVLATIVCASFVAQHHQYVKRRAEQTKDERASTS